MKLFRLVIPILAGLAMAVGAVTALAHSQPAPASPPPPLTFETDLTWAAGPEGTNSAENMHPDASGRLWISQDSDGAAYVRVFDPATHAYTDYTGLLSPNDAQLGPDGHAWWSLDDPVVGLARLDLASRTVTTWTLPSGQAPSLAFDSNQTVWILANGGSSILNFIPNTNQLCALPLPSGTVGGSFITEHDGAFWLVATDVITAGLARLTPTTNTYTFWPVSSNGLVARPSGVLVTADGSVTFAPNGDVWFSSEVTSTIGRLEVGANRVTRFNTNGGYTLQKLDYFVGKVWYTGQTEVSGTIAYLDSATATGSTPVVVTPTTTVLSPSCADAGVGITFTAGISPGVSAFRLLALTTTVDAQGVSYAAPISSQPASLVRFGSNLWLTDQGRNTLVEVVISPTNLYVPLVSR